MKIGDYLTEENLRLLVIGAGAGALGVGLRYLLRPALPWLASVFGGFAGFFAADRLDWVDPSGARLATAAAVALAAGLGHERLRSSPSVHRFVPTLMALACSAGVWLAVPENGPIVVAIGVIIGLAVVGADDGFGVGYGFTAAIAWAVLLGARPVGYSFDGGILCLAPLAAVPFADLLWRRRAPLPAWPFLVFAAGGLAFAAARWVGVAPDSTSIRIVLIAAFALIAAGACRRRA